MILMFLLYQLGYSFVFVFIASEFGHSISTAFIEIDYEIGQFDWYKFPMEMRKILPILLMVTQKPLTLEVFGSITCERETFKKVSEIAEFSFIRGA